MTDDLVKRLRKQFSIDETMQRPNFVATVYQSERDEAADRIEQLNLDIVGLKINITQLEHAICSYVRTIVSLEGVTFISEQAEDWQKLIYRVCEDFAAFGGKKDG